jgi:hypothetical protein
MEEEVTTNEDNGREASGQQAASKTVAPKGVVGSTPTPSAPTQFKCNLFLPNGMVRPQISPGVHASLARKWGDIIRCIPSNRWSTMDEIAQLVWNFENKSYLRDFSRTRKQIEDAVSECVESGVVLSR